MRRRRGPKIAAAIYIVWVALTVGSLAMRLRRYVQPSEFAWDTQLEPAYPRDRFWWMYVAPPVPVK